MGEGCLAGNRGMVIMLSFLWRNYIVFGWWLKQWQVVNVVASVVTFNTSCCHYCAHFAGGVDHCSCFCNSFAWFWTEYLQAKMWLKYYWFRLSSTFIFSFISELTGYIMHSTVNLKNSQFWLVIRGFQITITTSDWNSRLVTASEQKLLFIERTVLSIIVRSHFEIMICTI